MYATELTREAITDFWLLAPEKEVCGTKQIS